MAFSANTESVFVESGDRFVKRRLIVSSAWGPQKTQPRTSNDIDRGITDIKYFMRILGFIFLEDTISPESVAAQDNRSFCSSWI
jgi:hypothetical protein